MDACVGPDGALPRSDLVKFLTTCLLSKDMEIFFMSMRLQHKKKGYAGSAQRPFFTHIPGFNISSESLGKNLRASRTQS